MAIPFLLYPIAESTVSSSITGMINGGLPVVSAVVTAFWVRRSPVRLPDGRGAGRVRRHRGDLDHVGRRGHVG